MKSFPVSKKKLERRYISEWLFHFYCLIAVLTVFIFLIILLYSIASKGIGALWQTQISLPIEFSEAIIDPRKERFADPSVLLKANYNLLVRKSLARKLDIPDSDHVLLGRASEMISTTARYRLQKILLADPSLIGKTVEISLLTNSNVDFAFKGYTDLSLPENMRRISNDQLKWFKKLQSDGSMVLRFNYGFFVNGASSRPEVAGIGVSVIGSLYMILIVIALSFPLGIASAIYLEEFASKGFFSSFIQVNINNLASVPSVVYGILGSAMLINFFNMPRSTSLVGGVILSLMTLPSIIISTGVALRTVPSSIRSAALGLGASKVQTVFHHVLPLAMPAILTGSTVSLARALGETAPLLFVGMIAFVTDYPEGFTDIATAFPVQIYLWAYDAERSFVEKTFGAILLLLIFLAVINIAMICLRNRFKKRW
ncbi:phosphate ABC transporter permease PstA [Candidatus Liberibacter africanus]|uniref:Phosphate transport system permease protein PstA n=1 Tax=Candidatus Liberibacter africanus PTSAPSY TaxID=1277257 RepID=A0A0G3I6B9_LIBAF|nr:phosphate ABC transporter permease PstA [Candidatus Liberibacter africanus]AKK20003.1 phosphate ABC transporter permease protein PstA [Candidatus Liberibacter africanus PTSAPSY]